MENNAPFYVVCITNKPLFGVCQADWKVKKDEIYTVIGTNEHLPEYKMYGLYYELSHQPGVYYAHEHFRKINPYSNSVSKELANEAIKENIEVDVPVKKEVVNN
jgi:hypothetical protein